MTAIAPTKRKRKHKICTHDDCHRIRWRGVYCQPHWKRLVSGEIPADRPIKIFDSGRGCAYPRCPRPHRTGGFCAEHYRQHLYTGELKPILVRIPRGKWGLDDDYPTYGAAHIRARLMWGYATEHLCVECGGPAAQWAYDGTDPTEIYGPINKWDSSSFGFYSRCPEFYMPMCVKCHSQRDKSRIAADLYDYRVWKHRTGKTLAGIGVATITKCEAMDPDVVLATLGYAAVAN